MLFSDKRLLIITGHYGCGKTNLAINMAFKAAESGEKISLTDFDIVNPYFRTADLTNELKAKGIDVVAPLFAGTNVDMPVLPPQMHKIFDNKTTRAILDVGGDDAGAAAIGGFSKLILEENNYENFYVINQRRILTQKPEEAVEILREIEVSGHVPVTAIVNNTNLSHETDEGIIRESISFAKEVSKLSGLPLKFTAVKEDLVSKLGDIENILPIKIYIRTVWDNQN